MFKTIFSSTSPKVKLHETSMMRISSRSSSSFTQQLTSHHQRNYSTSVIFNEIDPGNIWLLDGDLFSPIECQHLIERSEAKGYKETPVTAGKILLK